MTTAAVIELGGRRFQRLEGSTVKHDFWLMAQAREAGLDQVRIASKKREDVEAAMEELLDRVILGGYALRLLGGLLLPDGMNPREWTPEVAAGITAHLELLTDREEKNQIRPLVASMLAGFFTSGLASLRTSGASSSATKGEADEPGSASAGD